LLNVFVSAGAAGILLKRVTFAFLDAMTKLNRFLFAVLTVGCMMLLSGSRIDSRRTHQDPCSTPGGNPVACENTLPGNPASEWDVNGASDPSIQGFATDVSVNRGTTIRFKISAPASSFKIDIYRLG
jgi:hypothetical protein